MIPPVHTGERRRLRGSALRRSALQRLGFVALPIVFLWLAVGFALDVWR